MMIHISMIKLSKIKKLCLCLRGNMVFPFLAFGTKTENFVNHNDSQECMRTITFLARNGCTALMVVCS